MTSAFSVVDGLHLQNLCKKDFHRKRWREISAAFLIPRKLLISVAASAYPPGSVSIKLE